MLVPAGTMAMTSQPADDFSVSLSASDAASYDETLIEVNSCMAPNPSDCGGQRGHGGHVRHDGSGGSRRPDVQRIAVR